MTFCLSVIILLACKLRLPAPREEQDFRGSNPNCETGKPQRLSF